MLDQVSISDLSLRTPVSSKIDHLKSILLYQIWWCLTMSLNSTNLKLSPYYKSSYNKSSEKVLELWNFQVCRFNLKSYLWIELSLRRFQSFKMNHQNETHNRVSGTLLSLCNLKYLTDFKEFYFIFISTLIHIIDTSSLTYINNVQVFCNTFHLYIKSCQYKYCYCSKSLLSCCVWSWHIETCNQ